ncbi:MAG: S-layer homology domain-containing protein [bacterium]
MRIGKRRISKKLVLILAPVVLVFGGASAAVAANVSFSDISGNTHEQSIIDMANRGITVGYPDGTFRPDQPVTRGQMMTFLDRADSCTDCHDDTSLIAGKATAWAESLHGTNESYGRGTSASCAGCHSGGAFSAMVAAGQKPDTVAAGDPNPTRQDCRTCHEIHTSYTTADWALETTAPVALFAITGQTFDGGTGNLCANCHQPRRGFPAPVNGMITGISTHWGPHHGPQSAMLLGVAGAAAVGSPSSHYTMVENTCVSCHAGSGDNHTFEPAVAVCTPCHAGATNFDINGVQTETQARLDELGDLLVAKGVLSENGPDGHPVEGLTEAPVGVATALYNWLYIDHEDKSLGVHNPAYTEALLDAAFAALQ